MRKIIIIVLLSFAFLFLNGCSTKETPTAAVEFTMSTFHLSSKDCATDSLPCAIYEVQYPVFTGLDSSVSIIINKAIEAYVSMGNPEMEGQPMKAVAENFINSFEEFVKDEVSVATAHWSYKAVIKVEILSDSLISLSVSDEFYTGGAHGGTGTYFINIDPHNGETITLDKVLKPGYSEALTKAGERSFRIARGLDSTTSLADAGFEFRDNVFALNQNYGFKKEGIAFCFNNYEIAPYVLGPTEVIIPYAELRDWMKSGTKRSL